MRNGHEETRAPQSEEAQEAQETVLARVMRMWRTFWVGLLLFVAATAHAQSGWFIVTDAPYNAVGNGTTLDYAALQSAINDAQAVGGTVFFPDGNYYLGNNSLVVSGTVTLLGSSRTSACVVTDQNTSLVRLVTAGADIFGGAVRDLCLKNTNGAPTSASVGINKTDTFRLFNYVIENNQISGVYTAIKNMGTLSHESKWLAIRDNWLGEESQQVMQYGIDDGAAGTGTVITGNQIFLRSYVSGLTAEAIRIEGPQIGDMVITNNHTEGGRYALHLICQMPFTYCSNFVIVGNKMDSVLQPISFEHITAAVAALNRYAGGTTPVVQDSASYGNITDTADGGLVLPGTLTVGTLKTTGQAGAKKVVCVDMTTGALYASSSTTQCAN